MKIALDATALYGKFGGIENAIWRLLEELAALDSENDYLAFVPADAPAPPANWRGEWRRLPFAGVHKLRRIFWQQCELPLLLRGENCDLLHALNYVLPLVAPVPVILTVQDLIALNHARFATRANRLHYRAIMPKSLKKAARIIVTTPKIAREVACRVPDGPARVRVVPLGVEAIFHAPVAPSDIAAVRQKYRLPARFGLFVGNFEPKKNLPGLLKALELAPNAPDLVIAGGVRPWPGHEKLLGHAQLLGYVERGELPALYAAAEMFLFPSLSEGFGLPVLEALSCGAAVVASRAVPLPNLSAVTLTPDPRDPTEIAAAIEELAHNAALRAQLGAGGREFGRAFSWKATGAKTLAIYHEFR